jgi:hypothetical protein
LCLILLTTACIFKKEKSRKVMGRAYAEAFVSEVFIKNYFYDIEHEEEFFLLYEVTYEDNSTRIKREKVRKEVYEASISLSRRS